jgi:hypothetical protein
MVVCSLKEHVVMYRSLVLREEEVFGMITAESVLSGLIEALIGVVLIHRMKVIVYELIDVGDPKII